MTMNVGCRGAAHGEWRIVNINVRVEGERCVARFSGRCALTGKNAGRAHGSARCFPSYRMSSVSNDNFYQTCIISRRSIGDDSHTRARVYVRRDSLPDRYNRRLRIDDAPNGHRIHKSPLVVFLRPNFFHIACFKAITDQLIFSN